MLLSCYIPVSDWIYSLSCLNVKELFAWNRPNIWSSLMLCRIPLLPLRQVFKYKMVEWLDTTTNKCLLYHACLFVVFHSHGVTWRACALKCFACLHVHVSFHVYMLGMLTCLHDWHVCVLFCLCARMLACLTVSVVSILACFVLSYSHVLHAACTWISFALARCFTF